MAKRQPSPVSISAGIGGAASGTGLLAFIKSLNLSNDSTSALILITHWVSLLLTITLNWCLSRIKYIQQQRLIDAQLYKAKLHRDVIMSDANATDAEKTEVREWYASLYKYKREFHEGILFAASTDTKLPNLETETTTT